MSELSPWEKYIASKTPEELEAHNKRVAEATENIKNLPPPREGYWAYLRTPWLCPEFHRVPEGVNEDIATCWRCNSPTFSMRPEGETFGEHMSDCSLPIGHESYCVGGGVGHTPSRKVRG